jgi:hypothetical protein
VGGVVVKIISPSHEVFEKKGGKKKNLQDKKKIYVHIL